MIDKKGQLKKISIVFILVLLVAIGIITAQNISEIANNQEEIQTNKCNNIICEDSNLECQDGFVALCPNTCSQETGDCSSCIPDCTGHETTLSIDTTNTTIETTTNLCENINCTISTLICPDNFIATCENSCILETGACTSCTPSCGGHEQTIGNQTETGNETETSETTNETETPPGTGEVIETGNETETPQLDIQLSYPPKITRGEIAEIKATITNSGTKAKKVLANWILPQNFEIISGSQTEDCGNLNAQESCISTISIQTSYSTSLGKNQIKIIASYENK